MFFYMPDKHVLAMAAMRLLSSMIELTAAILMLKLNRVEAALKINAVLALIGPSVMMTVMALGLWGLAGKISPGKMLVIIIGAGLIFYGVRR
ncbi:YqhV family protein [Moorella sulfitireducens (nom. illeg.)]|uniref:YqhV family protein n=1 Tax=Neomoorella sulfitireducens TaxID=2972948 RepID=UPI0021ACF4F2|nr:YqhV family protein [Moorella sulfitireducens]